MPQQLEFDGFDRKARDQFQTLSTALIASNDFWWQWPCTSARWPISAKRERRSCRLGLARQKLLEQQRLRGEPARLVAFDQRRNFVAEAEDAARLQPDHRHAALDVWRKRRERAFGFAPGLVDLADGEKGAAAAERAPNPSAGFATCTA